LLPDLSLVPSLEPAEIGLQAALIEDLFVSVGDE
jgi:hypothetical protein